MAQTQVTIQRQHVNDEQHIGASSGSGDSNDNSNTNNTWGRQQHLKVTDHPRTHSMTTSPRQFILPAIQTHYNSSIGNSNFRKNCLESSPSELQQPFISPSYDRQQHSMNLGQHIYQRGLLEGIGSDIVVKIPAWQGEYHLHRLILDQNPYFQTLFQGGFRESSSSEITLHFENHPYITADSFNIVLERLYGSVCDPNVNTDNVQRLLATCSFFQLDSMCELCVEFILQSLSEHTVIDYLLFADGHLVFGSDRICDAIFTFLCREAYAMDIERLVAIPAVWLKKLLHSDSLWVPSEYHRYRFIHAIIQRRYAIWCQQSSSPMSSHHRHHSTGDYSSDEDDTTSTELEFERLSNSNYSSGLIYADTTPISTPSSSSNTNDPQSTAEKSKPKAPTKKCHFSTTAKRLLDSEHGMEDKDLCSILVAANDIISHSIHYMHMTFEQLEAIRQDVNPFNRELLVPDSLIKDALWNQIQLRSKVGMAVEEDKVLGLTTTVESATNDKPDDHRSASATEDSYAIPTNDITAYTGESTLPCTNISALRTPHHRTHQVLPLPQSSPIQQQQQQQFPHRHSKSPSSVPDSPGSPSCNPAQYAQYPPFRFSVEFKDVANLRRNVRVYSKTVFYAGSNWNMYIQKTRSQRKGILQLGVYLHRQSIHSDNNQQYKEEFHNKNQNNHHHHHHQVPNSSDQRSFSFYSDKRIVTKTWFKIFCPSRSPKHTLTLFQSSPDDFSVLQSWGWRSTVLCADEVGYTYFTPQQTPNQGLYPPPATTATALDISASTSSSSSPPPLNAAMGNLSLTSASPTSSQSPSPETINPELSTRTQTPLHSDLAKQSSSRTTLRFSVVMGHV